MIFSRKKIFFSDSGGCTRGVFRGKILKVRTGTLEFSGGNFRGKFREKWGIFRPFFRDFSLTKPYFSLRKLSFLRFKIFHFFRKKFVGKFREISGIFRGKNTFFKWEFARAQFYKKGQKMTTFSEKISKKSRKNHEKSRKK